MENLNENEMILPQHFLEDMQHILEPEEFTCFIDSYKQERSYGMRYNPLKLSQIDFEKKMPYHLRPVPWTKEGYWYQALEQPGKSIYHEAGAYYIQDPSAMAVVTVLDPRPGENICDLCAAPGGKSTHIAGRMQGDGLLVSNEIHPNRAKILSQNIERMGIANALVLNETTDIVAAAFPVFFDRVLVDAPCSGEGMFRKEEEAIKQWSRENVHICQNRQLEILEHAVTILRPGGVLVYSTCTFAKEENEDVIAAFLQRHKEFQADENILTKDMEESGIVSGYGDGTIRLWPHLVRGEGHFVARLLKCNTPDSMSKNQMENVKTSKIQGKGKDLKKQENFLLFQTFCKTYLKKQYQNNLTGEYVWFGTQLYLLPRSDIPIKGLKIERAGLHLGEARKNRFEPSHSWAMALKKEQVIQAVELQNPAKYLHGESDVCDFSLKGWTLALISGVSVGWGKAQNGQLKNHYPKGLRKEVG